MARTKKSVELLARFRYASASDTFIIETSTDGGEEWDYCSGFMCRRFEGEIKEDAISYMFATKLRDLLDAGYQIVPYRG